MNRGCFSTLMHPFPDICGRSRAAWVAIDPAWKVPTTTPTFNTQNLRGQALLCRCLETGYVTNPPALTRYQQGRGIDPSRRELVGERPPNWIREAPTTVREHCRMVGKGNQWTFRQHQRPKRCQKPQRMP